MGRGDRILVHATSAATTTFSYEGDNTTPNVIAEAGDAQTCIEVSADDLPVAVTDPDGVVTRYAWTPTASSPRSQMERATSRPCPTTPPGTPPLGAGGPGPVAWGDGGSAWRWAHRPLPGTGRHRELQTSSPSEGAECVFVVA